MTTIAMTLSTIETTAEAYSPAACHPYSLEVIAPRTDKGHFQWAIRRHGKLIQRSDRPHASEAKAQRDGLSMIERLQAGTVDW